MVLGLTGWQPSGSEKAHLAAGGGDAYSHVLGMFNLFTFILTTEHIFNIQGVFFTGPP